MSRSKSKLITSLAVLKANWDVRHFDYIDNFIPLFVQLIKNKNYKEFDVDTLANLRADFEDEYGLTLPYHPAKQILIRLKKNGFIKQSEGKYIIETAKYSNDDFAAVATNQKRKLAKLIDSIIQFGAKEKFEFTNESAEEALLSFLKENNLGFLSATQEHGVLPESAESKSAKYIVAKFIQHAKAAEPEIFRFLVDVSVGVILASALAYGENLSKYSGIKGLSLYLDAGYIFALLGINGKEKEAAFSELAKDLTSIGAKLFIFEHTYDEVMRILSGALFWMRQPDSIDPGKASRALQYFSTNEFGESDVESFMANVEIVLGIHNIQKVSKPNYSKDEKYQIGEEELRDLIVSTYKSRDPFFDESVKDETINKDIESIYSICKLRRGHVAYTLKDASHIFITTNFSLAKISSRVQSYDNAPYSIPPCITDVLIGTLVWLQQPARTDGLNEKKLMADAFAALRPDAALIKTYFTEIENLRKKEAISSDEYFILRTNRVAFNLLSEKTKNDSHNFEPRTAREIMDEINKEHISDLRNELNRERKIKSKKIEEAENLKVVQENLEQSKADITKRYDKLTHLTATILAWVVILIIIPLLLLLLVINTFPSFTNQLYLEIIAFIVLAILTFGGFSIPKCKAWAVFKIETLIKKKSS